MNFDFSTVKAASRRFRTRVATMASSVSLPIDPDSHSEGLVGEQNVFFAYQIFLTPSGLLLARGRWWVFRGCGCGTYTKHDMAEVSPLLSNTVFGTLRANKC